MSEYTLDVASLATLEKQWQRSMRFGVLMAPLHPAPSAGDAVQVRMRLLWEGVAVVIRGQVVQVSEANTVVELSPLTEEGRDTLVKAGLGAAAQAPVAPKSAPSPKPAAPAPKSAPPPKPAAPPPRPAAPPQAPPQPSRPHALQRLASTWKQPSVRGAPVLRAWCTGQGLWATSTLVPVASRARSKAPIAAGRSIGSKVSTWPAPRARATPAIDAVRGRSGAPSSPGLSWKPVIAVTSLSRTTAIMSVPSLIASSSGGMPAWKKVESPRNPRVR